MKKLGFIGGGNMAEALIRGLLARRVFAASDLIASDVDRSRRQRLKRIFKIDVTGANNEVVRGARALLIAVKPQNIDEVLAELKAGDEPASFQTSPGRKAELRLRDIGPRKQPLGSAAVEERLFISIAAGITIARLSAA